MGWRRQHSRLDRLAVPTRFQRGFSLLEMSMVVLVSSLFVAFILNMGTTSKQADCYTPTKQQIGQIREGIERFAVKNDRFPIPALRNIGTDNPLYGREATPAALDATGGVLFGALPFQALGLSPSYGMDCWGNKFTYAVTTALTVSSTFLIDTTPGMLNIKTNAAITFLGGAGYVIISHGQDELGAVKANYGGASNQWCNYPGNGELRSPNCALTVDKIDAQFNNGKDAGLNYFDDLIAYRGKPWRNMPVCSTTYYQWGTGSPQCAVNVPTLTEGASATGLASTIPGTVGAVDMACTGGLLVPSNQSCTP